MLTIETFLDVKVSNISAILSKACFSSLAASSCIKAANNHQPLFYPVLVFICLMPLP